MNTTVRNATAAILLAAGVGVLARNGCNDAERSDHGAATPLVEATLPDKTQVLSELSSGVQRQEATSLFDPLTFHLDIEAECQLPADGFSVNFASVAEDDAVLSTPWSSALIVGSELTPVTAPLAGKYRLEISHPGWPSIERELILPTPGENHAHLETVKMTPFYSFRGAVVVDAENGRPITKFSVRPTHLIDVDGLAQPVGTALEPVENTDGKYWVPGNFDSAIKVYVTISADGYESVDSPVQSSRPGENNIPTVALSTLQRTNIHVSGRVVNDSGLPVQGAAVLLLRDTDELKSMQLFTNAERKINIIGSAPIVWTDKKGEYSIKMRRNEASARIAAFHADYESSVSSAFTTEKSRDGEEQNLTLHRGGEIEGVMRLNAESALELCMVTVSGSDGTRRLAPKSNPEDPLSYTFQMGGVLKGDYEITVYAVAKKIQEEKDNNEIATEKVGNEHFNEALKQKVSTDQPSVIAQRTLSMGTQAKERIDFGTLGVAAGYAEVSGNWLTLDKTLTEKDITLIPVGVKDSKSVRKELDRKGNFDFKEVNQGQYFVVATATNRGQTRHEIAYDRFNLNSGNKITPILAANTPILTINIQDSGAIAGRNFWLNLNEAQGDFPKDAGLSLQLRSDENGEVTLLGLPPGTYQIQERDSAKPAKKLKLDYASGAQIFNYD